MSLILAEDLISTIAGAYCFPRLLLALFAFIEHFPELVAKSRLKTISAQLKLKLELSLTPRITMNYVLALMMIMKTWKRPLLDGLRH